MNTPNVIPLDTTGRHDCLCLIRSRRVGPATFYRLLDEHETPAAALAALPELAAKAGVPDYVPFSHKAAYDEMAAGSAMGLRMVCVNEQDYPPALRQMPDPPPVLWMQGNMVLSKKPAIAIVGARNASSLGTRMARLLARELGEAGYSIVSGMARGIDAAAHDASLPTGTLAVQAGGIDVIYPKENTGLFAQVAKIGLCLSEQPLGLVPQARHFPQRNRIIAGLAEATLVVEGAMRSGSLITARDAADFGREVMAVPGSPLDARAAGCNALIRDGACLIRSAQDVIDALQKIAPASPVQQEQTVQPQQPPENLGRRILERLGPNAVPEDCLIRDLGLTAAQITPVLTSLELEGRILRHPGGFLAIAG
ncbi:DNA-processing protein DprA [Neptunicoccus cionae]|uniref:DNA-processing protein DprA n=1 Tax=Neptunicoccus cionae TaxID=2035344 RepID=UPI000C7825D4|nr:DNA-processing protein DprA [Amylibacter cionae]PLS23510.1 DNA-protecting protein DprA [Amylibacter cionae]